MEKAKKYEISFEQYEEGVTLEDMVRSSTTRNFPR